MVLSRYFKMKESNWEECLETNSSLEISPARAKARSLIETAQGRNDFLKNHEINENNASYIFEGYYSSALEILHSLVLIEGYKISNHICLGYYLRDVLKREDLFRIFDSCRFKRNSLIYYGKRMDLDTAKKAIKDCLGLIKEIEKIVKTKV